MSQITLKDMDNVSQVFPDRKICRWLKIEDDTGILKDGEVFVMGTCKLFSGVVYDRSCYECNSYEAGQ